MHTNPDLPKRPLATLMALAVTLSVLVQRLRTLLTQVHTHKNKVRSTTYISKALHMCEKKPFLEVKKMWQGNTSLLSRN